MSHMTSHQILANNLRILMAAHQDLDTQAKLGEAAEIDQTTIGRILRGKHSPSLDKINAIAKAFNVEPWQLLVPNIDPKNLPVCDLTAVEIQLYKKLRTLVTDLPH